MRRRLPCLILLAGLLALNAGCARSRSPRDSESVPHDEGREPGPRGGETARLAALVAQLETDVERTQDRPGAEPIERLLDLARQSRQLQDQIVRMERMGDDQPDAERRKLQSLREREAALRGKALDRAAQYLDQRRGQLTRAQAEDFLGEMERLK
jgi:hypothetical protein